MRKPLPSAVLWALCAAPGWAHGLAIEGSTPVSPPAGFTWVTVPALLLLVVTNTLLIRRLRRSGWDEAGAKAALGVLLFATAFYGFGWLAARCSTRPPPGLDFGHPVLWGLGWQKAGGLFVMWNLLGIAFLLFSLTLVGGLFRGVPVRRRVAVAVVSVVAAVLVGVFVPEFFVLALPAGTIWLASARKDAEGDRAWTIAAANVVVYVAALSPFLATGALAGGWTGGYYQRDCVGALSSLGTAMVKYTREHGGHLPTGRTTAEVLSQIRPYLQDTEGTRGAPLGMCPAGPVYDRDPEPYRWNADVAGMPLESLRGEHGCPPLLPVRRLGEG